MKEGPSFSLFRNFDFGFFLPAQAYVSFYVWLAHRNFNLGYCILTAVYVDLESSRVSLFGAVSPIHPQHGFESTPKKLGKR